MKNNENVSIITKNIKTNFVKGKIFKRKQLKPFEQSRVLIILSRFLLSDITSCKELHCLVRLEIN